MKSMCHDVRRNSPSVAAQAEVLLQGDDVADRVVFGRAELVGVDAACAEVLPGRDQLAGAEQAADVLGPERRLGAGVHGRRT
jgi:hypothetical protein